jgi:extracellular factor (EF) 3-hydroxypalmitic acid methyl ester biosynthesis protein
MESTIPTPLIGEKDSFIACRNSQGTPVRGSLMHFSYQNAVFEVYNPFSILQLSEVLNDFKLMIGDRALYVGRAVVSNLVNTGIMLVCEVTLIDSWSDVDILSILNNKEILRGEVERFVTDWRTNNSIVPEFKILTSDFQGFLSELSLWLKQVEMTLARTGAENVDELNLELVDRVVEPVKPLAREFMQRLEQLGDKIPSELVALHKAYIRRDLHPLTLCCPFIHRSFTKPLGYAGDYAMINMILDDPRQGSSIFSRAINALVLGVEVAEAHRNRITILRGMLEQESQRAADQGRRCSVLNVACGPAREVVDLIKKPQHANRCDVTLLDFSKEALAFAREDATKTKEDAGSKIGLTFIEKSIDTLLRESIIRGAKSSLVQDRYHVVYCAGLFDYLSDSVCRRLLLLFYEWLLPGGLLMATNVHSSNPQKFFMEYVLEWNVVHRDERQMAGLIEIGEDKKSFVDETGVNVFLSVRKPAAAA